MISEKEKDEFCLWAFGCKNEDAGDSMHRLNAWNALHSEELVLHPEGLLSIDLPKMEKLWRESRVDP